MRSWHRAGSVRKGLALHTRINFQNYPLDVSFGQQLKANSGTSVGTAKGKVKDKGLFNLGWLRKFRFWVGASSDSGSYPRCWWRSSTGVMKIQPSARSSGPTMNTSSRRESAILCILWPNRLSAECNAYGTSLMVVLLVSPKLLGQMTADDAMASLRRNLGVELKHLYVSFKGLEGFAPSIKKYFDHSPSDSRRRCRRKARTSTRRSERS